MRGEAFEALRRAMERPPPRVALGLALRGIASAAIDLSDGLVGDLGHVLRASAVGATLRLADIPHGPHVAACSHRNAAPACWPAATTTNFYLQRPRARTSACGTPARARARPSPASARWTPPRACASSTPTARRPLAERAFDHFISGLTPMTDDRLAPRRATWRFMGRIRCA